MQQTSSRGYLHQERLILNSPDQAQNAERIANQVIQAHQDAQGFVEGKVLNTPQGNNPNNSTFCVEIETQWQNRDTQQKSNSNSKVQQYMNELESIAQTRRVENFNVAVDTRSR